LTQTLVSDSGNTLVTLERHDNQLVCRCWDLPAGPPLLWVIGPPLAILFVMLLIARPWRRWRPVVLLPYLEAQSVAHFDEVGRFPEAPALSESVQQIHAQGTELLHPALAAAQIHDWVSEGNPNCQDLD